MTAGIVYTMLTLILCNAITGLGLMIVFVKPTNHSNLSHVYNPLEIVKIVDIAIQGVHVIEYVILIYGFLKFHHFYMRDEGDVRELLSNLLQLSKQTSITVMLVVTIVYPPIFLISPILYRIWFENQLKPEHVVYVGTVFLADIFNGAIRAVMIFVTVLVRAAWLSCSEKSKMANSKELLKDYDKNCKLISSLQGIFQPWFVLQWLIYFIAITEDCMTIIRVLTTSSISPTISGIKQNKYLALTITTLVYNISVFVIPYTCGTTMNYYYKEYRKTLQDKQKELLFRDLNDSEKNLKTAVKWILNKPEHLFIPSLCCLSIPLNNVGHILTILLSLLAPVISLMNS